MGKGGKKSKKSKKSKEDKKQRAASQTDPDPNEARQKQYWLSLSHRTRTAIVVAVAALGGILTFDQAATRVSDLLSERQPGSDTRALSKLQTGMRLDAFSDALGADPVATIGTAITVGRSGGDSINVRNELFFLETSYVEAFTSDDDEVIAFKITTRDTSDGPRVRMLGHEVVLGQTKFVDIDFGALGPRYGAADCAGHIGLYYEFAGSSGATLQQTFVAGATIAGNPTSTVGCGPPGARDLPAVGARANNESRLVPTIRSILDVDYIEDTQAWRQGHTVNSVGITAPSVEPFGELIALHPQVIFQLDPKFQQD